jgi:DNA-binding MarR family transcriptional regulator
MLLHELIAYKVKVLDSLIRKEAMVLFKPFGVAPEQFGILKLIDEGNTKLKFSDLAELAGKDKSTITRMMNALEKKALITKCLDSDDRRVHIVTLTPEGKTLLEEIDKVVVLAHEEPEVLDSQEQQQFHTLIDKLINHLNKELS